LKHTKTERKVDTVAAKRQHGHIAHEKHGVRHIPEVLPGDEDCFRKIDGD